MNFAMAKYGMISRYSVESFMNTICKLKSFCKETDFKICHFNVDRLSL